MTSQRTISLLCILLLTTALFSLPGRAQQNAYDQAVAKADDLVRQGKFIEALGAAQEAIRVNPDQFKAYYYAAFALYRRDLLSQAKTYAQQALERAPAADKADVQRLLDAIAGKEGFSEQVRIGDEALEQGLIAKAATAYARAWEAVPAREDIGLKAAKLWVERLDNPAEAAPILNGIVAAPKDAEVSSQATQMLKTLRPALERIFNAALQDGQNFLKQKQPAEAIKALSKAQRTLPDRQEAHLHPARAYAQQNNLDQTIKELSQMLKKGRVTIGDLSKHSEFRKLSGNQRFLTFITDALGGEAADQLGKQNSVGTFDDKDFVRVSAGEFMMGSERGDDEKPVHRVRISQGFELGKYEVTQAQWEAVMGQNPSHFKGASLPVGSVSWEDVQRFLERLNEKDDSFVYRLPTEAEWEYACRAGSSGDYAGSLDAMAWYEGNSGKETHPVGQKQPNAWGLYDMHGNVWEWVQDWYGESYYGGSPMTDPRGPGTGSDPVMRGGSWHHLAVGCRSAIRGDDAPGDRDVYLGFRLVRALR